MVDVDDVWDTKMLVKVFDPTRAIAQADDFIGLSQTCFTHQPRYLVGKRCRLTNIGQKGALLRCRHRVDNRTLDLNAATDAVLSFFEHPHPVNFKHHFPPSSC